MHLTFEQANLDHAPYFGKAFSEVEDQASADLMQVIFEDEIRHVRFGSRWLKKWQPEGMSMFETYAQHCAGGRSPFRAKGLGYQKEARLAAGLDADFVSRLEAWETDRSPSTSETSPTRPRPAFSPGYCWVWRWPPSARPRV